VKSDGLQQEVSKQKWAIIIAVVLISSIWGAVLFLEYKISQNKGADKTLELEKGLCVLLPKGCHAINGGDHFSLYCQSGTVGKVFFSSKFKSKNTTEIKGKTKSFYLELKVNDDENRNLATVVDCPKN